MPRRRKRKEPENQERWLITYSDLITLLMIFFVIMFAMSKVDVAKFQTLAMSLQSAMNSNNQSPMKMNPGDKSLLQAANTSNTGDKQQSGQDANQAKKNQKLDDLFKEMQTYINNHNLQNNVQIADQNRGVQVTLRDVVLFDTGQAVIKPDAAHLLTGLVPFFKEVSNPVVVEGYTDNTPITTSQFPSNWELSSARAMNVVHFLADQKIAGDRLSGVGYGEFHAVVANDSEAHKQMNRRVNIVILRTTPDAGTAK